MKLTSEIKRKIVQIAAFGYSNSYVGNFLSGTIYKGKWKQFCNPGMNCYSCPAARFACPIGAMQAVGGSPDKAFSFYVIGFILAIGVIFGRAVCGFICPFGFIQELLYKIPFIKRKLPKAAKYVKYIFLVVFVLILPVANTNIVGIGSPAFCEYICPVGTLEAGIPFIVSHPELRALLGSIFSLKAAILFLTIIGCLVAERFFCKVMCPLGAIYGILNKISIQHLRFDRSSCVSCGKCADVCPMDVNPCSNPDSAECIRCGKCVSICPSASLLMTFKVERKTDILEKTE